MIRAVAMSVVLAAASIPALANPPLVGSEDYDQLMPYADWISGRSSNGGGLCCSVSDCRVVGWRMRGAAYEAYIAKRDARGFIKFVDGPDAWLPVPAEVIKREGNPTGRAIACWSAEYPNQSGFYCFFLPDLT